jgi:hypothetical protein
MAGSSYGELGSMILHQTLYNMFPPSSFDAQSIAPLTPQDFIQRILVPEAALALIMEDTGQDRIQAGQTMRESAGYGVAMFPDTSEGPGVGAGEDIVLERARVRRRELYRRGANGGHASFYGFRGRSIEQEQGHEASEEAQQCHHNGY